MDETIANWIIEFLLRQRIDDKIINGVISSLPLSNNDYRLKKTMLLRRIESETSNGCISEKLLQLIEIIEALDHENGKTASDLMKVAYCSVAVDCTVRFLGENVEENEKYVEMVEIVWKNRVCKSEGLVSEMAKNCLIDIEKAVKDKGVCEKIWMRNTRNEALKAVKAYLKEAWECLGLPFLEAVAAKAGNEVEELRHGSGGGGGGGDRVMSSGTQKGQAVIRRKHVAAKRRRQRGAKISDAEGEAANKAGDTITGMVRAEDETPEVDRVKEAISLSSTKLPDIGDHLSDSVQTAQTLPSTATTGLNNVLEADQVGLETLESREVLRMQRALKGREVLHKARTLLSSMATYNHETAARNPTGPDLPTIPEAVGVQKAQEMTQKTVPNAGNDSGEMDLCKVSIENDSGIGKNAKADLMGPEILESLEVVRLQRTLKNSTRELHTAMSDPLPEALQKAPMVANPETQARNSTRPDMPTIREADKTQEMIQKTVPNTGNDVGPSKRTGTEMDTSKGSIEYDSRNVKESALNEEDRGHMTRDPGIQKNVGRKRSLMEPNDTSHTYEWEDEIENSAESPARPILPRPKVQRNSPSKVRNFRRRERKRWTPLEEETLREGVLKYGRGNWKVILIDAKFSEVLKGRTEVDLKDKWRNLTKYS